MKTFIITALALSTAPSFATPIKDTKCADVIKMQDQVTPEYMAVVDGYNQAGKKVNQEVDMAGIVSTTEKVKEECAKNKSAKLDTVKKNVEKTAKKEEMTGKTALNPTQAKCEEFVALDEEVQPVAAFWVAGHDKSGVKKGEVDEVLLDKPVLALVEECKAQPQASFYDKAKNWIHRKI